MRVAEKCTTFARKLPGERAMIIPEYEHLWKTFGASTTAGKLLREIYDPSAHERVSKRIAYPELQCRPAKPIEPLPKIQRPKVATPKFLKSNVVVVDDKCSASFSGRRSAMKINAEMESYANQFKLPTYLPVDRELERRRLQERFQFSRTTCLPQSLDITKPELRCMSSESQRLDPRDSLLRDLIEQVKEDQESLECWADEVANLKLGVSAHSREKMIQQKHLEQMRLKNKIVDGIRDIKKIIDCDN